MSSSAYRVLADSHDYIQTSNSTGRLVSRRIEDPDSDVDFLEFSVRPHFAGHPDGISTGWLHNTHRLDMRADSMQETRRVAR